MKAFKLCIFAALIFFGNICAFPQAANEQGIKPYGAFHGGDLDQVNLSNGHLELRIPLLSYPQRGGHLKLSFIVRYHNAVWNQKDDCAQGVILCIHSWGFDQQSGMSLIPEQTPPLINQTNVGNLNSSTPVSTFTIRSADESQHAMGNIGGTVYESLDATGMRWDSSSQTFTMSDGSRYNESNGSIPILEDTNGNQISFNLGNSITDTMGRSIALGFVATQDFSGCTGLSATSSAAVWTIPGANGGTSTFKFCNTQVHVYTAHFSQLSTSTQKYIEPNGDLSMLQSIVLPDGTAWTFEYSQPNAGGVNWGDLVKVILPTGGSISYTWGHFEGCHIPFGALGSWSGGLSERDVDANDGTGPQKWVYVPGQQSGQVIVRDPLNNDTVHTFTDLNTSCSLYETRVDTYNGFQNAGKLAKSVTTDYSWTPNINVRPVSPQNPPPMNVVPSTQTTIWPNGQTKKTTFSYDLGFSFNSDWGPSFPGGIGIYGKETARQEYDYGANVAGSLLKSTITNYWWQSAQHANYLTYNVLDVPSSVTLQNSAGNIVSQSTIAYDEVLPGSSGIATSHDVNPINGNVRGNPTTTARLLSSSTVPTTACPISVSNGLVPITNTFLDTGVPSTSSDACKQKSTYQYSSDYAGAFLTQSCNALNQCTTNSYDFNTGALSSVTDSNKQKTSYTYDGVGRLKNVTYPDGGQINAFYPNPTTVEIKKLQDSIANVWIDNYAYFDGWLRPVQSRLVDPEGDVFSETTYDPLGRVYSTTNPHRTATAPTDGTTTKSYDALGRVLTVTEPDKNVLQTQYNDPGVVTLIDETSRRRRETFDALGRLVKMEEPTAGSSGSQATAAVNIGGTLQSKVFQTVTAVPGTVSVTITGAVRFITIDPCAPGTPGLATQSLNGAATFCPQKIQDTGTIGISVNGHADSTGYQGGSTPSTVATGLANAINQDANAFVTASALNGVLTLTARSTGAQTDYSWNVSSVSSDPTDFGTKGSFSSTPASGALAGGVTGNPGGTVVDAGSITMTVAGYSATINYGSGAGLDGTASAIASDLVSAIRSQLPSTNPPFSIGLQQNPTTISFAWGTDTAAGNSNSVTVTSTTSQTATFSNPSFAGCSITGLNPQICNTGFSGGADPFSLDASPSWPTLYSYDLLGNLLRVEQHGNTTDSTQWRVRTFQYDSLSHVIQSSNPEAGQLNFTYDAGGGVITRRDNRGLTITYAYDALHRLTQRSYADSTPPESFVYDQTNVWGASLNNTIGRLTYAVAAANTAASVLSYDSMGRVTNQWVCLPSNCGTSNYPISAQYDMAGHLRSLTYPSGRTVTSGYNSAGRALNSVFSNFGTLSVSYPYYTTPQAATPSTWGYNPDGSLHLGTFGNGISETYGFNNRGQLNFITASSSGQTWLSKLYGLYDVNNHNNGSIWSIIDGISATRNQSYQYDAVGRVTSGSQQDNAFNQTFNYDPWGNMSTSGTNNFNPMYDGNNRVSGAPANCTAANAYCYDAAGNMLNDAFHQYAYDGANRIKTVDNTGATYTYAAGGERVRKDTGGKGTEYVYFQGAAIAEKDISSGNWSDYVFFNGRRIAKADGVATRIRVAGTWIPSGCTSGCWSSYNFANAGGLNGYVIQSGDRLFIWQQYLTTGTQAGPSLNFSDGTWSDFYNILDQDGCKWTRDCVGVNASHYRRFDLSSLAGKTITAASFGADGQTWTVEFSHYVLVDAKGTVHPIYTGEDAPSLAVGPFGQSVASASYSIVHDAVPQAGDATTAYYHDDQIGSSRLMTAGGGWPLWQGTFTPFGQEVSPQITTNHYKFNGKERGEATEGGLDYFGARYYSSVIGRWMTPDWSDAPSPVPYAKLTDPQSLNLYSYVTDDPLSHTDMDGHFRSTPANQICSNNNGDACKPPSCESGTETDCQLKVQTVAKDVTYDPKNPNSPITVSLVQSYVTTTNNEDGTVTITKALVTTTVTDSDNGQSYSQTVAGKQSTTVDTTTGQTTYGPSTTATRGISENEAARQFTGQGGPVGVLGLQAEMIAARTSYSADFKSNLTSEQVRSLEHSQNKQNDLDDLRHGVLKIIEALEHVR